MSYLGPDRVRSASSTPVHPTGGPARARPYEPSHDVDWQQVAVFGAGLALGIAFGAGIALLTAPQAGTETREDLRRGALRTRRALGRRSRNAWLDLRDELRDASLSLRQRTLRRSQERARSRELARESRG